MLQCISYTQNNNKITKEKPIDIEMLLISIRSSSSIYLLSKNKANNYEFRLYCLALEGMPN